MLIPVAKIRPADEAGTVESTHSYVQGLHRKLEGLDTEYIAEAKKKLPSSARLVALSGAIETLQSSFLRQNLVAQRYKDGLHPKQAAFVDNSQHASSVIKAPGLILAEFQKGSFDAIRELVDEAKKSGTGFAAPAGVKPGRNRFNP